MLGWLVTAGLILVAGILADDWYAKRHRRPLSLMKPDIDRTNSPLEMQNVETTRINRILAENELQSARNSAKDSGSKNNNAPRSLGTRNQKDGPKDDR